MHHKENYKQGEKTAHRMGENKIKWNTWQGIDLQTIQAAHAAQNQKTKQPNLKKKKGKMPIQAFLQRNHTDG